ncbi:YihY/virulence factor BrkB family protein [Agriterribacter sp.]|uniref:YihY/virulence factor BrkB family protein n=1 Tax=Agriterribacter sp. TaxID=2821509 RepID=UPI002B78D8C0|nr:YihY/virulence factor BrkB family protein [Agriterribacter sp.]HRO48490.1 YihY/virulence factor BrkB family protein [Agriterribacter sp.]HRQ16603.1 YihY/virulence factor BrkB family protein [Agriterribacter sp.]
MTVKGAWKITKQTFSDFIDNKVLKLSAALAYYTIFSLPGLIIVVIWISDIFYGDKAVEGTVYGQIAGLVGRDAALQIQQTIRNATLSYETGFATTIGIATLIFGATSIFGEIQDSINAIWRLKAKPRKGWVKLIVNRLLSFSLIITLGFLLLVSLIINAVMDAFINKLTVIFPHTEVIIAYVFNVLLSFAITSFLFGLIFKVLPDAKIEWRHVRAGAFTTALLFMIGKLGISYYLGHNRLTSAYGAAGSVIVILLWVYYSATILYFGAVFTRVYAIHKGSHIYPNNYAVWIEQVEVESDKSVQEQAKDL